MPESREEMVDLTRRQFLGGSTAFLAQHRLPAVPNLRSAQTVARLRCEYAENPLGIDIGRPRLSWVVESAERCAAQTAYQVFVASDPEILLSDRGDLWDSGRLTSNESSQIVYEGKELRSRQSCHWKVRVWDNNNAPSGWSSSARWETALLDPTDWRAKWIGAPWFDLGGRTYTRPAPFFRKNFEVGQAVTSARVYVCGLGFYELYLNGAKVGDQVLSPNQTNYDRRDLDQLAYPFDDKTAQRVDYLTFDLTKALVAGTNVIGAILGNGWYNQRDRTAEGDMWYGTPKLIAQLEIAFDDGSRLELVSDETWSVSDAGPLVHDGIFTGERYDARLGMDGWLTAGFDAATWHSAMLVPAPTGWLTSQYSLPDRVVETIPFTSSVQTGPQVTRFDFGQNLAGWVRITVDGARGENLSMQFAEDNDRTYSQSDSYVLKGGGEETYEPRFTWHGFKFVDVLGSEDLRKRLRIEARVVHTDVEETGTFRCSNDLFNKILHNCRWSQWNNMHCGVPSDCPHRERVGYTGDWGQVSAESAIFNFDMARFYTKWINDIGDAQNCDTGFVPHSAPYEGGGGGPPWGCAFVTLPWILRLYYADQRVMEEHYAGMKRWVEYLQTRTDKEGIVVREEPGDWDLGEWATPTHIDIPPALVNTCYYAYVAQLMAKTASLLKKTADIASFKGIARAAATAVNRKFFNESRAQYWEGRQGANVFPLAFGLVPPEQVKAVFDRLVEIVVNDNDSHFDTGIFATRLLLNVLTEGGRGDLAYELMNQKTQPSFGWQIAQGATTLWENWNGESSHNHAMFGGVCQWFYQALAGINPDPMNPGFKHIVIRPYLLGDLSRAEAKYRSIHGEVGSSWVKNEEGFHLNLTIPANCTATVLLPNAGGSRITESSQPVERATGVNSLGLREGRVAFQIESGAYSFSIV
jgi:alpha-L-rhamnosidase